MLFLPRKFLRSGSLVLNSFIPDEIGRVRAAAKKVRPPRFVSFTMELEPYSKKKAFALEILHYINMHVFETETIHKLYSMNAHVVIITGKRIICVDEHHNSQIESTGLLSAKEGKPSTGSKLISGLD